VHNSAINGKQNNEYKDKYKDHIGLCIGLLYQYSDTVFAIRRFNNTKDGEAFLFPADCNVCVSHNHRGHVVNNVIQ